MTSVTTRSRRRALTRTPIPASFRQQQSPVRGLTMGDILDSLPFSDLDLPRLRLTPLPGGGLRPLRLPK